MEIYEYKVPIPGVRFTANVYLIKLENNDAILVDTGPNAPQALDTLKDILKQAEVSWENIKHILVTHGHYDHFSFAAQIVELTGAHVYIHPADHQKLTATSENPFFGVNDQEEVLPFLVKLGIQKSMIPDLISEIVTAKRGYKPLLDSSIHSLADGTNLNFHDLTIKVIHTPGHSAGSCCFQLLENDVVFTGDTLLPNITPNPLIEIAGEERDQNIVRLQDSMTKIRLLGASKAYPGHGKSILSVNSAIDKQLIRMAKRCEQVFQILGAQSLTTYSIANQLFPSRSGRYQNWLALSETLGQLGWLRIQNRVRVRQDAGVAYWEAQ